MFYGGGRSHGGGRRLRRQREGCSCESSDAPVSHRLRSGDCFEIVYKGKFVI